METDVAERFKALAREAPKRIVFPEGADVRIVEAAAVCAREGICHPIVLGHAVPMPVVVRTREYGSAQSYKELGFREAIELKKEAEEELKDLWG